MLPDRVPIDVHSSVFLILFPFLFVGMWCFASMVISLIGWFWLGRKFAASGPPSGTKFGMQSAKIGLVSYSNCLTIHTSPSGIHLATWFPWRIGHRPLLIPWDALRNPKPRRFLWIETVEVDVGSPRIETIRLPKKVFEGYSLST
jgi:hypothetical protein